MKDAPGHIFRRPWEQGLAVTSYPHKVQHSHQLHIVRAMLVLQRVTRKALIGYLKVKNNGGFLLHFPSYIGMIIFVAQWLLEMSFCAGALCIAPVDCATTCRYAGFPCLHSHIASNKYFSSLALRIEMAFQRFPALVVVFI